MPENEKVLTLGQYFSVFNYGYYGYGTVAKELDISLLRYTKTNIDVVDWEPVRGKRNLPREYLPYLKEKRIRFVPSYKLSKHLTEGYLVCYGHYLDRWFENRLRLTYSDKTLPLCSIAHDYIFTFEQIVNSYLYGGLKRFDTIVVPSNAGKLVVEKLFRQFSHLFKGWNLGPKIEVIQHGIDTEKLKPIDKKACRKKLGIPEDRLVLLTIGRFSPAYKIDFVPTIIAFSEIVRLERANKPLLIIAGGQTAWRTYLPFLKKLVSALKLSAHVKFFPDFKGELKPVLYNSADIFISCSDHIEESFGLVVAEAMSCGIPTIATDWDGYRELVKDGKTGMLVKTYTDSSLLDTKVIGRYGGYSSATLIDIYQLIEKIRLLVSDKRLRQELSIAARRFIVEKCGWEDAINKYLGLWRRQSELAASGNLDLTPMIDLSKAFDHYPSELIDAKNITVRTSKLGKSFLDKDNVKYLFPEESYIADGSWDTIPSISALEKGSLLEILKLAEKGAKLTAFASTGDKNSANMERIRALKLAKYGLLDILKTD